MSAYPRISAIPMPLPTIQTAILMPRIPKHSGLRGIPSGAVMATQGATGPGILKARQSVQVRGGNARNFGTCYEAATPDAACALRALRSVQGALTIAAVVSELSWTHKKARRWLEYFSAKGVLIPTGKGHRWAA